MYSTTARQAPARVGQACVSIISPFSEAKNDSATALSQHWPLRPTDSETWQFPARAANAAEVYWQPRPGVEDHPGQRVAGGDCVGQGVGDELGAQVVSQGEPDHAAGGDIDDRGQVEPPFPGGDVG